MKVWLDEAVIEGDQLPLLLLLPAELLMLLLLFWLMWACFVCVKLKSKAVDGGDGSIFFKSTDSSTSSGGLQQQVSVGDGTSKCTSRYA